MSSMYLLLLLVVAVATVCLCSPWKIKFPGRKSVPSSAAAVTTTTTIGSSSSSSRVAKRAPFRTEGFAQVPCGQSAEAEAAPISGIIPYKGRSSAPSTQERWVTDKLKFAPPKDQTKFKTSFNLARQWPWKRIDGKILLKAKVGGSFPLEATSGGLSFGGSPDLEPVDTLTDVTNLFHYASYDPRVEAILLEIEAVQCGYAKLAEVRRAIDLYRQSGKQVIAYMNAASEKELYLALGCDKVYIPPDGGLDLRGFVAAAQFFRGIFDKIGIEPQVQRIGKYKSFGDTFNRTSISEAQREVISSLLMEASDFWLDSVAATVGKNSSEVIKLWSDEGIKTVKDFYELGYISGVKYLDQVEQEIKEQHELPSTRSFRYKNKEMKLLREYLANATAVDISTSSSSPKDDYYDAGPNGIVWQTFVSLYLFDIAAKYNYTKFPELEKHMNSYEIKSQFAYTPNPNKKSASEIKAFSLEEEFVDHPRRVLENLSQFSSDDVVIPPLFDLSDTTVKLAAEEEKKKEDEKKEAVAAERAKKRKSLSKPTPRYPRFYPAGLYMKKMRAGGRILEGLRFREVRSGPRVAIINAVGGIQSGKSGSSGLTGQSLGSETLIAQVKQAKLDDNIKAVVLRVDSPGGSALASDLMWREIRALSREKPVIASMVDVAASGGYYIAMACDQIFAEELTVTGSIGVVTSKFNAEELNKKLGLNVEVISRGRYAEVLSTSRPFTKDEETYFEEGAQKAYKSFITKAAASRNMSVDAMNDVAQGRVWTGKQAQELGLVDRLGGLWAAVRAASHLAEIDTAKRGLCVQTIRAPRSGLGLPFGIGAATATTPAQGELFLVDDFVASTGLASPQSLGMSDAFAKIGLGPLASQIITTSGLLQTFASSFAETASANARASVLNPFDNFVSNIQEWLEDNV